MKKALIAMILGTAALAAQADPLIYSWSYTGYLVARTYSSIPSGEYGDWIDEEFISGSFKGEDLNGDSRITMEEISNFKSRDSVCAWPGQPSGACRLFSFSYDLAAQKLDMEYSRWTRYQTIDMSKPATAYYSNDLPFDTYYFITPQTKFNITTAIPEPSTYLMLGTGLGLLGLGLRRRRA
ncbi:PEP-CTERM sorting domain-containing protein [[Empedobacter] haloabium]|uniref:PEP-CTERM sorting domain-containing protein n=1 Tax=[Empedobacter] haloabium TaxID=592317 RepID=A0ABZ1UKQ0_9BURK